jgi:carbon storage regulator
MLVLSRKENEEVVIDRRIRVKLVKLGRGRVRLGISAPSEVDIHRGELLKDDCQHPLQMHELAAVPAAD